MHKIKKTEMFSLFLTFSDPKFEEKYQKDFGSVRFLTFNKFVILELILAKLLLIFNIIYDEFNYIRLFLIVSIALVIFLIILCEKTCKKWKYMEVFMTILHFSVLMVAIDLISSYRPVSKLEEFYEIPLIYCSPLQVLFCAILIARLKWLYSLLLSFVFHLFFVLKMYSLDSEHTPLIVITHTICVFAFAMMGYYHETSTRGFYKLINDSNKRLLNFEILVKNIIPTSIFIVDLLNKKNEFSNNAGINFLKNHGYDDNIMSGDVFQDIEQLLTKFKPLDPSRTFPNLLSFITDAKIMREAEKMEFLTVEACLEKTSMTSLNKMKYYQFKFLKIIWESKPCLLLAIDDISESHQIKELKNLDDYKNKLLATVSHDLRTPLNGMLGMMELVELNLVEHKDKKNLGIAIASGHLLLNMINDILDFSQINNKKLRLNVQKVNLIETIKETCKLIKFQAKAKGLEFKVKTHQLTSDEIIFSDNNRIRQILLNLLNNALKFTQTGFINLSIKKNFDFQYQGFLYTLKVKDSGIGIKPEDKPKLFKLFGKLEQEDPSINSNGVGLGLTISQNLAQLLSPNIKNSGIQLESAPGKGSKFWFVLEGETQNDVGVCNVSPEIRKKLTPYIFLCEEDISLIEPKHSFFHIKAQDIVLVVDDDMVNLMVAQRYCEYFDIGFISATNGKEAVELIINNIQESKKINFKGIFMDCNMPIMDGFRATEKILEVWQENKVKEIPIIGMTANVLRDDLDKCIKCGMRDYLCKPVSRSDFGKILKNVFLIQLANS